MQVKRKAPIDFRPLETQEAKKWLFLHIKHQWLYIAMCNIRWLEQRFGISCAAEHDPCSLGKQLLSSGTVKAAREVATSLL